MVLRKILEGLRGSRDQTPQQTSRSASLEQAEAEFEAAERELGEVRRRAKAEGRALMTTEEVAAAKRVHAQQLRLIQARAASVPGTLGPVSLMELEEIAEIGIDGVERLYVKPLSSDFTHIYRAGMEVHWSPEGQFLYQP